MFQVPDLKRMLKERGLPSSGNKAELILRLQPIGQENGADVKSDDLDVSDDVLNDDLDDPKEAEVLADPVTEVPSITTTAALATDKTQAASGDEPETKEAAAGESPDKCGVVIKKGLTEEEKIALRAKKFGVVSSEEAKKAIRAQRFGLTSPESQASETSGNSETDKLKLRGGRFAIDETSKPTTEVTEKLKKRAERFGTVTSTTLSKIETDEKLLKRKMRFGANAAAGVTDTDTDEKKRKRAERFGMAK
ncbi:hypothetical protein NP493_254g00015 [Ridgeia piscesae]|uniref:SAP domain-containing protein n=1 Tax=Ridgeia piscesae TaxID=27915 RepID=A0AAD9NYC6_RIDPI|nr:hypothetical protein NP493_254g00015 [Ridgeia piscesae]